MGHAPGTPPSYHPPGGHATPAHGYPHPQHTAGFSPDGAAPAHGAAATGHWPGYWPYSAPSYAPGYAPSHAPGYAPGYASGAPHAPPGHAAFGHFDTGQGYAPGQAGAGQPGGWGAEMGGAGMAGAHPGAHAHAGQGRQAGVSDLIEEIASGGNGLNSLSRLLNFDDTEFWKGALVGAAALLLLSNESVQNALFGSRSNQSKPKDNQEKDE